MAPLSDAPCDGDAVVLIAPILDVHTVALIPLQSDSSECFAVVNYCVQSREL